MRSLAISIFLYACETWTLTADLERRISALEMRCYRKILGISYKDHITNEEVRSRIAGVIGPHEDLLTTVKRRKLKWYGHVTRSNGMAKTIMQGTVEGTRRRGRQKKSWEDNIPEWTVLKMSDAVRRAEDRNDWRKLVSECVAPQRSTDKGIGDGDGDSAKKYIYLEKLTMQCPPPAPPQVSNDLFFAD